MAGREAVISPGLMPSAMGGGVAIGGVGEFAEPQACIIDPYPCWPPGYQPAWAPIPAYQFAPQHTHYHFTPLPPEQRLSDDDIERIAKRVAELLRGAKP